MDFAVLPALLVRRFERDALVVALFTLYCGAGLRCRRCTPLLYERCHIWDDVQSSVVIAVPVLVQVGKVYLGGEYLE